MGHATARSGPRSDPGPAASPDRPPAGDAVPRAAVAGCAVDHEEALEGMRGRAVLALGAIGAFVAGTLLLHPDSVHPRALDTATAAGVYSGSWFCPHGGGAGWSGR